MKLIKKNSFLFSSLYLAHTRKSERKGRCRYQQELKENVDMEMAVVARTGTENKITEDFAHLDICSDENVDVNDALPLVNSKFPTKRH